MGLLDQISRYRAQHASPASAYDGELALKEREDALNFVPNNLGGVQATPATMRNNSEISLFNNLQQPPSPQGMSSDDKRRLALGLASGFAGMSGNPNAPSIMAGIQGQQAALNKSRDAKDAQGLLNKNNLAGIAALKAAGVDDKLLAIAKSNPKLMESITKSFAAAQMNPDKEFKITYSTPRVDEKTGEVYIAVSDPNKNSVERILVPDTTGLTTQQKADIELATDQAKQQSQSDIDLNNTDIQNAKDAGIIAFNDMTSVAKTIVNLTQAKKAVKDDGASVGFAQNWLPAFDAATSELREIANKMGIEVINSATFGALSETELKLALTTAFPTDLNKDQLLIWIEKKINAQNKMYKALSAKAKRLSSGITMSEFITENTTDEPDIDSRLNQSNSMSALQAAIQRKKAALND